MMDRKVVKRQRCFAQIEGKRVCGATGDVFYCGGLYENCPFYKSETQQELSKRRVFERIASLPPEQQSYISEKYYRSTMPWHSVINNNDK